MDKKLNRIKSVLADNYKTNKWLAEQLEKYPATVSKWCMNAYQSPLALSLAIAKLLNVELTELVGQEELLDQMTTIK